MPAPPALDELYRDLHRHPELSFEERRTAAIAADRLRELGYEVTEGIGGTGVAGVLRSGVGPTVLLRADMDGLPVAEETGVAYASRATATRDDGTEAPVMHACGHDMHVTCLLGAAERLADQRGRWAGTIVTVFQPAEEIGAGAQAMVDDGLYDHVPVPDVVLGQHVGPLPAGMLAVRAGPVFAASDTVRITLHGRGGHASRPQTTVDPIVLAATTVLRLQTIVARELAPTDIAVVTVGSIHAGDAPNIIPPSAQLQVSVRSFDPAVRTRVLNAIERIVWGEAQAAGAPRDPDIEVVGSFPVLANDPDAVATTRAALASVAAPVVDPGLVTGSEDVGLLATAAGAPCVYWLLGGADPAGFRDLHDLEAVLADVEAQPSNHSPRYAPVIEPTITTGVAALVAAARAWLAPGHDG